MKFFDRAKVTIKSGTGGSGIVSFGNNPSRVGVPDGGHGGRGGSVYFIGSESMNTLADFRYDVTIKAGNGNSGGRNRMFGRGGEDVIITLPIGTQVRDAVGNLITDVMDEEKELILKGGKGGVGNSAFKSSSNRSPQRAIAGQPGFEQTLFLELKLLADVCIMGYPNAGKSSLIGQISNSKSRIDDYEFTTLYPHIGVVLYDFRQFTVLDLPGLIDGASEGRGKGIEIMRHGERCKILLHLLDSGLPKAWENYNTIWNELNGYVGCDFTQKPEIIALNKTDIMETTPEEFYQHTGKKAIGISCASGEGVDELICMLDVAVSALNDKGR